MAPASKVLWPHGINNIFCETAWNGMGRYFVFFGTVRFSFHHLVVSILRIRTPRFLVPSIHSSVVLWQLTCGMWYMVPCTQHRVVFAYDTVVSGSWYSSACKYNIDKSSKWFVIIECYVLPLVCGTLGHFLFNLLLIAFARPGLTILFPCPLPARIASCVSCLRVLEHSLADH